MSAVFSWLANKGQGEMGKFIRVNLYVDEEADNGLYQILEESHPKRRAEILRHYAKLGVSNAHSGQPVILKEISSTSPIEVQKEGFTSASGALSQVDGVSVNEITAPYQPDTEDLFLDDVDEFDLEKKKGTAKEAMTG